MTKTFKEIIDGIRTAILGIEVREDIAQGMEYVEQFAETSTTKAQEADESATAAGKSQTAAETAQKKAEAAAELAGTRAGTDKTFTVEDAPADAKAVGDALKNLNIRPATSTTLGGIKVGSGLSVTDDGTLSADAQEYTLPIATTTTLGGVKVGSGLTVDSDGRLSADSALASYPVGSIYQSTDPTSPAAMFGGSWEEIASDRVLMGASSAHAAGTTVEAGLPNIRGSLKVQKEGADYSPFRGSTRGLLKTGALRFTAIKSSLTGYSQESGLAYNIEFDASISNSIYGRSGTVQPAAYYVHIWRRVA